MAQSRFSARAWQREHRHDWARWVSGQDGERTLRLTRLAIAVENLVQRWTASDDDAASVVRQLVPTLGRCNELDFSTQPETLAYTIWHLVDRYARVLLVLDELMERGHLPLRKTRLSTLEIGAGPSPAVHAVRDFYCDLPAWNNSVADPIVLTPVTHMYSLDRGAAWSHLVHAVAEELLLIGDDGPHTFSVPYSEFDSFSVQHQHRQSVEALASWLQADAHEWDEYFDPASARRRALATHDYAPGATDLVILSNFVTEVEMTREFADELALLARSLTPGGVLMILGSDDASYRQIFDAFLQLVTTTGAVRPVFDTSLEAPHSDLRIREVVSSHIVTCLQHLETLAPSSFSDIRPTLPADVRHPGSAPLRYPTFRVAAFKNEGTRPPGRWGRRRTVRG